MIQKLLIILITFYQYTLASFLGPCCRFYPSCSHYAIEALGKHRLFKALWLIFKRLTKCHPWHPGGFDPP